MLSRSLQVEQDGKIPDNGRGGLRAGKSRVVNLGHSDPTKLSRALPWSISGTMHTASLFLTAAQTLITALLHKL